MTLERNMTQRPIPPTAMRSEEYWQGEIERHFLLIAARNLVKAIELMEPAPEVDPVVRAELIETRDLLEHWTENMPVFNITPRPRPPGYRSGKDFAARNPDRGPYCWWSWSANRGPMATPNVSGIQLHELVEATVTAALAVRPEMAEYMPPPTASPWIQRSADSDGWWPKRD
jgi:hypothetical protein